jgi:membrane carboxypeptidase/penicillin-binding protein
MNKLGPKEASDAARRMGISTVTEPEKYGLTLGVGTAEVRLIELANAYAAFANKGDQYEPVFYTTIKDKYGGTRFKHKKKSPRRVISSEASFLVSSILSDKQARAPTFNSLTIANRDVAAKTGTTDNNRDAWTMGYTPSLAVGVWVGNNANEPMRGIAGSSGAGPIWRRSVEKFLGNSPAEKFEQPAGIEQVAVCKNSGLRADREGGDTYREFFKKGTLSNEKCNARQVQDDNKEDERKKEEEEARKRLEEEEKQRQKELERQLEEVNDDNEGGRGGETQEPPSTEEPASPPTDGETQEPPTGASSPEPTG